MEHPRLSLREHLAQDLLIVVERVSYRIMNFLSILDGPVRLDLPHRAMFEGFLHSVGIARPDFIHTFEQGLDMTYTVALRRLGDRSIYTVGVGFLEDFTFTTLASEVRDDEGGGGLQWVLRFGEPGPAAPPVSAFADVLVPQILELIDTFEEENIGMPNRSRSREGVECTTISYAPLSFTS